jgi:hypothetical protein
MKLNITIPENLSDIKLWQYQKFLKIQTHNDDPQFLITKMIEIFCEIKSSDVLKLRVSDSNMIIETIQKMLEQKPKLVERFKMNDVEFGFIPDLDDMTLGEYIDLDTNIGDWENIHKAMAVLYRPIKSSFRDKYSIIDYDIEAHKQIDNMPMDVVLGSVGFFYHLGIELSKVMTNYLETDRVTDQHLHHKNNSVPSGVGINHYTDSLRAMLQNYNILLN